MAFSVYTIRHGWLDTKLWSGESIVGLYKANLKGMGFSTSQIPLVLYPDATVNVTADDPFKGARRIDVSSPLLGNFSQTRDTRVSFANDPAKLADVGRAFFTTFSWNLCHPSSGQEGALREFFRKVKPDEGTLKLSPKVSTWEKAPDLLAGYPQRPPNPNCGPAPAPVPAPPIAGKGKGKGKAPWGKIALAALGLWVAKNNHFL